MVVSSGCIALISVVTHISVVLQYSNMVKSMQRALCL